ncbi:adenosylcobinamide-GDP ribazoletransferase [Rhizobium sp. SL42]|uniref:adenosylcobinamide-GDP ribazoletransferase n=1 Tax=Rhizobium sp. SL42 TaxID=2806346 RepID=UPI001F013133|nr:adenosylcobinamide-GDP ribazoletransferase [Rhizobium sp. SL42]UJW74046.1 adenosylcobinamide-GDP ribazoletransferase [Rhizobium sp. SL42]
MLDWRAYIDETARAVSFLSRLPVPDRCFTGHDGSLSRTAAAFPLAGLLIALPSAFVLWLSQMLSADATIAALLTIAVNVAITGALHEDGLSDTADGLGGGHDREKALTIMKDSRIGTYGALALILSIALRTTALAALCTPGANTPAIAAWLAGASLSRGLMAWHWSALPSARVEGVASRAGAPGKQIANLALVLGGALAIALGWLTLPLAPLLAAVCVSGAISYVFTARIRHRLGGQTGDTIGACQQFAEIGFLVTLAIAL